MSSIAVGISKRDILIFFLKWKSTIFGGALFTVILATAFSYFLPQVYLATAKVVMESTRAPTLRSSYAVGLESVEVMNNEIAIIRSRPVMTAVVDQVAPHERPSRDSQFKRITRAAKEWLEEVGLLSNLTPRQRWIESLLRSVETEPVVNSNVLEISYYDEDPDWAAKIVNAVIDQYMSRHVAIYSSQGVTDFYREQVDSAQGELDRLRQEVLDYKQRRSISAVTDRRLELVRELTATRGKLAEARAAHEELLTRYEPGHVAVKLAYSRVASLVASETDIQKQLEALEQQQSDIEALEIRIRFQEATFLELKRNYEKARLNAASNAETINVRLLEYAASPVKPRFPRLLVVLLSIPLGLTLSMSMALLREHMDHRVSDPDTAESALGVPCLGSIPRFGILTRRKLG